MARKHGRSGRLYMALTSAGTAEPVTFIKSWSIDFSSDRADVTCMGDSNKVYVAGLPDAQGNIAGVWDDATVQLYTASQDGVARKFYLYPDNNSTGIYWFGTMLPDFSVSSAVDDAVNMSGTWAAASAVIRIG